MKVVLFCGGLGMRMRDGVTSGPKPMAMIGDRPLMWHVMRYYAHFGHTDFVLCLGYGAASRAVALLNQAKLNCSLLPAVVDASPAKQGLRMPGTDIPVISPAELAAKRPEAVLVFVPDLLAEVRSAFPEVEAAGGRWIDAEAHGSGGLQQDA